MSHCRRYKLLWTAALLLLTVGVVPRADARYVPQTCKNSFTVEQEIAEGQKLEAKVLKSMPVLPESDAVSVYVRNLGARLVSFAPGQRWPFSFHVIRQKDINAFALPGGPIFINLGTIQAAENEAQLAGVMAHEISHVVQRHATCNLTKQQKQTPFWVLGQIAAQLALPGSLGEVASSGIGTVAGLGFLKMSRDAERQADLLGTDILYDAGYDPRGMSQFFEVIQGKYGQGGSQFLSDHPNPGNRTGYVNDEIATLPARTRPIQTSEAFKTMKKRADGMQTYTAQQVANGAWKTQSPSDTSTVAANNPPTSVAPGADWRTLEQPQYTVSYPGSWHVYDQSGSVTIAPQNGLKAAEAGQGAVIYGVVIDAYAPAASTSRGPATQADLAEAMQQLIAKLQAENPQMHIKVGLQELTVNGRPARDIETSNSSSGNAVGGSDEHDWIVGVQQPDGQLRYLVFVAPSGEFEQLRPTFERLLRTLQIRS
ncbi:MAG TPA: M48 family metalloprotease [Acidobacteriaceae bacterium]